MNKGDVLKLMIQKGESKLQTAIIDYQNEKYDDAVSRAYYAVFHLISAALEAKDLTYSSHNQTIGAFNKEYIKNSIFNKAYTSIIQRLFDARQEGDYSIISEINKNEAEEYIQQASIIVEDIGQYIRKKFIEKDLLDF